MFTKCDLKPFELNDNSIFLGLVQVNETIFEQGPVSFPVVRDTNPKLIIRIGKRNYEEYDKFIIAALNDYYRRIDVAAESEKALMLTNYNQLYHSWTMLNQVKSQGGANIDSIYDSLSYQLYLLGYKMSND